MILSLIAKDIRQSMGGIIFGHVLLFAPVLIWFGVEASSQTPWPQRPDMTSAISGMFLAGVCVSVLATATLGGVSFAKERRERTMEHLVTLPIPRWKVVLSKALVALTLSLTPVIIGLLLAVVAQGVPSWMDLADPHFKVQRDTSHTIMVVAASWVFLLGVSWLCSSLLRSEVLSTAVPILLLIATTVFLWLLPVRPDPNNLVTYMNVRENIVLERIITTNTTIGLIGMISGTAAALLRRSP